MAAEDRKFIESKNMHERSTVPRRVVGLLGILFVRVRFQFN